jgi:hypothetical protein
MGNRPLNAGKGRYFSHPHIIRTGSFSRNTAENLQHLLFAVMSAQVYLEANFLKCIYDHYLILKQKIEKK